LDAGVLVLATLKRRRRGVYRAVPVPPSLLETLDLMHGIREAHGTKEVGQGCRLGPWSRTTAWQWVRRVMQTAQITGPHTTPKGLRHGFGIAAVEAQVPLHLIMRAGRPQTLARSLRCADGGSPSSRASRQRLPRAAGGATCWPPVGSATRSNGPCALPPPSAPRGLSGAPPAPRRSARSTASRRGERWPAQRGPGGRTRRFPWRRRLALARTRRDARQRRSRLHGMPAPLRIALKQLPALASRGPRARRRGSVAAGSHGSSRLRVTAALVPRRAGVPPASCWRANPPA
jgi:hypothetical protein